MRSVLVLLTFFVLILTDCHAQIFRKATARQFHPNAKEIWINSTDGSIKFIAFNEPVQISVEGHSQFLNSLLHAGESNRFVLSKKMTDQMGNTHYRYQQYVNGYKIESSQYILHTKNGAIISANGHFSTVEPKSPHIVLSEKEAFEKALKAVSSRQYYWENTHSKPPNGELVYLGKKGILAYKFDIYSIDPLAKCDVYVDAEKGDIIRKDNGIHTGTANGTAHTKYNGVQSIITDSLGATQFILRDLGRSINTLDLNNGTNYTLAVNFSDSDNIWTSIINQDDAALDAHWGTAKTFDFYLSKFGLNSFDGQGTEIKSYIHYGSNYTQAFWDGFRFTYGDGDITSLSALTSLDLVAHEFTHAVTQNASNLLYTHESGALNESFSDIFGVAVDFHENPTTANWLIGEQVHTNGTGYRNLGNPKAKNDPDTYKGTNWYFGLLDNGGVHTNSGVQNFWFYLLCNGGAGINDNLDNYAVSGIGMNDALEICYRNLTVYLSDTSGYEEARFFAIKSAIDLFGSCSSQEKATTDAWHAVGLGDPYVNSVTANFNAQQHYYCNDSGTVYFSNTSTNDTSVIWLFGDGVTDTVNNPIHTYSNPGQYTVSLIANSGFNCGLLIDTLTIPHFINISGSGGPLNAFCTPIDTSGLSNFGIFNFSLNTINHSTLGAVDGYQDYSCEQSTTVTAGDFIKVSLDNGAVFSNSKVFIDYNNNGLFEPFENVFSQSSYGVHSGLIQIPKVNNYNTPLRVRAICDSYNPITNSCSTTANYSQIEDYSIYIDSLNSPPKAVFSGLPTHLLVGGNTQFSNLSPGLPSTVQWVFPGGYPDSSNLKDPIVTYVSPGNYPVTLIVSNAFGADTLTKTNYIEVSTSINMCGEAASSNAPHGIIYDDGGLNDYSNNKTCTFLIQPHCADSIVLSFSQFDLENNTDYLTIFDGATIQAPVLLQGTGNSIPNTLTAISGSMLLHFNSDSLTKASGFAASWQVFTSNPLLDVSDSCINLDTIYLGHNNLNQFAILNMGCDSLIIDSISTSSSNLICTPLGEHVIGGDSTDCIISALPTNIGAYAENITIYSNANDTTICVNGVSVHPSIPLISDSTISLNLKPCDSIGIYDIVLHNLGLGNLSWSIGDLKNWVSSSDTSGNILFNDSVIISLTFNSNQVSGLYLDTLRITTNSPFNKNVKIPIFLEISDIPCPNFTFSQISPCNKRVQFNNLISGNYDYHLWDFGDGDTSTSFSPTHNYPNNSTYTVKLLSCFNGGCDSSLQTVTVASTNLTKPSNCIPEAISPNPQYGIIKVGLGAIQKNSGNSQEGYLDNSCNIGTELIYTLPQQLIIETTSTPQFVTAWIDYNNDGFLAANEKIANAFDSGTVVFNFIPDSNTILSKQLRLRITVDSLAINNCILSSGQTEDYYVEFKLNDLPPQANVSDSLYNSCDGKVQFKDQSLHHPTSWNWFFGDGNTSILQNPLHEYKNDGNYTVRLIVGNSFGSDTVESIIPINVFAPSFTYLGYLNVNQILNFTPIGDSAITWNWDFGNGITKTNQHPSIIYSNSGMKVVTLSTSNINGCLSQFSDSLFIQDPVSIQDLNLESTGSIHPNPSNGEFTFSYKGNSNKLNLRVYSIAGQIIYSEDVFTTPNFKYKFNLLNLSPGTYLFKYGNDSVYDYIPFIVQ